MRELVALVLPCFNFEMLKMDNKEVALRQGEDSPLPIFSKNITSTNSQQTEALPL